MTDALSPVIAPKADTPSDAPRVWVTITDPQGNEAVLPAADIPTARAVHKSLSAGEALRFHTISAHFLDDTGGLRQIAARAPLKMIDDFGYEVPYAETKIEQEDPMRWETRGDEERDWRRDNAQE